MNQILKKVEDKQLKPKQAYQEIYPKNNQRVLKRKKAHFVKLAIKIPDSKGVTAFLKILFALPIPILFAQPFIKKGINKVLDQLEGFTYEDLIYMIKTRGVSINVKTSDGVKIRIYTI
jgi:hypothetical protein